MIDVKETRAKGLAHRIKAVKVCLESLLYSQRSRFSFLRFST